MAKKILGILKYVLFVGLGFFLVWWSLDKIPEENWPYFKNTILNARYWVFIPVFFILSASHLLRAYRWRMLMEPMGYRPHFANTFFAVMVGYLANLAVPRLGEVLKCTILSRYEKVPADKLVGTIVAERAVDVLFLLIIFLMAFFIQYDIVAHYSAVLFKKAFADNGAVSPTRIVLIISVTLIILISARALLNRYRHVNFVATVSRVLRGIWQGLLSVGKLKHKWQFLLSSIAIWVLYVGGTWLGFYATQGSDHLGLDVAVSALAFGSIGMILTPGGFGTYAVFIALIMQKNGISQEVALANGNLQWFAQFIIVLIVGFISLGLLPYFNKHKNHEANAHHSKPDLHPTGTDAGSDPVEVRR